MKDLPTLLGRLEAAAGPADPVPSADGWQLVLAESVAYLVDDQRRWQALADLRRHGQAVCQRKGHESRGVQKIGRTLCVNPGSDYSSGVLRGAVIDLAQDGSCLDFLLTTG